MKRTIVNQEVHASRIFRNKNLPIYCVHDCFCVKIIDCLELQKAYFEGMLYIKNVNPWVKSIESHDSSKYGMDIRRELVELISNHEVHATVDLDGARNTHR